MERIRQIQLNNTWKRGLSFLLSFLLVLQYIILLVTPVADAASEASSTDVVKLTNADVQYTESLVDNGDGTYTLTLSYATETTQTDRNEDNQTSRNNYFVAPIAGQYLVEIWGGDGGNGQNTQASFLGISYGSDGGKGGAGGHVYGLVTMNAGDVLFYTLGGNGVNTLSNDEGGGVNGDGGHHGDTGSVEVGGGGGYSAVFKFTSEEFAKYLNDDGSMNAETISEDDRKAKYIMIAAGGGGGGGGDGLISSGAVQTADGGRGGYIGGQSGQITNGAVDGTYYSGENGKSSGTSDAYIGMGGTNEPGRIADTIISWFEGKQPNNWAGDANLEYAGGSGGSGNLRGGAGGGGYCGGSGGVMTEIAIASNVGGGGGGSSFVASSVDTDVTPKGTDTSETGGTVSISYSGNVPQELTNVTISGQISKYFTIQSINGAAYSGSNQFAVKGSLSDENGAQAVLVLAPVSGFAGGNNVPLLADEKHEVTLTAGDETKTNAVAESCAFVNVPLNINVGAKNYGPVEGNTTVAVTNLYEDLYAGVRGNLAGNSNFDFISAIGTHYVKSGDAVVESVAPATTTTYDVYLPVTVKGNEPAVVGQAVETSTLTAKAAVFVISENVTFGDTTLNYSKNLVYENGEYVLSLSVNGSVTGPVTMTDAEEPGAVQNNYGTADGTAGSYTITTGSGWSQTTHDYPYKTYSYTTTVGGYYMIQLWGGKGGSTKGIISGTEYTGGNGGYIYGYKYFDAGETLTVNIGGNGDAGTGSGYGGTLSSVADSQGNLLLIACGGEGAEQLSSKDAGPDATANSTTVTTSNGTINWGAYVAGSTNYRQENMLQYSSATGEVKTALENAGVSGSSTDRAEYSGFVNNGGGAFVITCLVADGDPDFAETEALLDGYKVQANFADYFTVRSIDGVDHKTDENGVPVTAALDMELTGLTGAQNINPYITYGEPYKDAGGNDVVDAAIDFTVNFHLTPNVPGGNDVPVLVYNSNTDTGMTLRQPYMDTNGNNQEYSTPIAQQDATDYANVEIANVGTLTTSDYTYVLGTTWNGGAAFSNWTKPAIDENFLTATTTVELSADTAPVQTTLYAVTATVAPKAPAEKAVVIPSIASKSLTKTATVTVVNQVIYNTTNLKTSDTQETVNGSLYYTLGLNEDYEVVLTPAAGYVLPDSVTVQVDGADVAFTYHADSGELYIPASSIQNRPVTISADAASKTFSVRFIDQNGNAMKTFSGLKPGASLDEVKQWAADNAPPNQPGYTGTWVWETETGLPPAEMPDHDIWVMGAYMANPYPLTVKCYEMVDGAKVPIASYESVDMGVFQYEKEYSAAVPEIPNYAPLMPAVSGTMTLGGATVEVEYVRMNGMLVINYLKADGTQAADSHQASVDAGESYSVLSPVIDGYTADKLVVEGVMADENGAQHTVTYNPNRYSITFTDPLAADGKTVAQWTVQYDELYGYDYGADPAAWQTWPQPATIPTGKTFGGWYLDENHNGAVDADEELIKGDTVVKITQDSDLIALWEDQLYYITVEYRYEDDTVIHVEQLPDAYIYNQPYEIIPDASIVPAGFQTEMAKYTGTMGTEYLTVKIICWGEFDLVIHYIDYETGNKMFADHTETVRYTQTYDVPSPEKEGYEYTERIFGTMDETGKEFTVYYYEEAPVISVTVEWGDMTFAAESIQWNPEEHVYDVSDFTPQGSNTVTVKSNDETNVSVFTGFAYTPRDLYTDITASFTDGANPITGYVEVPRQQTVKAYLNLDGSTKLTRLLDFTSGSCSVTITNVPPS